MKVCCIQMNMELGCPEANYARAAELIDQAAKQAPDVILLPETWNTGFYPQHALNDMAAGAAAAVKELIGGLAKKYCINIIAGSISDFHDGKLYNTSLVFDRHGSCIASYNKTHLFSPMGENRIYTPGDTLCSFEPDGVKCGLIICYDIRFPELIRSLALKGMDVLFMVSQWPDVRIPHLHTLAAARAIENQAYVVCCNSCGKAGATQFGGKSIILNPLGETITAAGGSEEILTAELDLAAIPTIRSAIPVFRDRRPDIYEISQDA